MSVGLNGTKTPQGLEQNEPPRLVMPAEIAQVVSCLLTIKNWESPHPCDEESCNSGSYRDDCSETIL